MRKKLNDLAITLSKLKLKLKFSWLRATSVILDMAVVDFEINMY